MREIFVTNNNDFHHQDAYDGIVYDFPPKERVAVPVEAAVHMFGFNQKDKTDTLQRLGWASQVDRKTGKVEEHPEGVKWLARFAFTKAVMVEAPVESADAPLV